MLHAGVWRRGTGLAGGHAVGMTWADESAILDSRICNVWVVIYKSSAPRRIVPRSLYLCNRPVLAYCHPTAMVVAGGGILLCGSLPVLASIRAIRNSTSNATSLALRLNIVRAYITGTEDHPLKILTTFLAVLACLDMTLTSCCLILPFTYRRLRIASDHLNCDKCVNQYTTHETSTLCR